MRRLVVTADDFGLGPATSDGILALADEGLVTSTVLLANSPYAADGVARWAASGRKLELGWHPCLTLDGPVLPARQVPSLVGPDGRFRSLGDLLLRLARGRIHPSELHAELAAQLARYGELVGEVPRVVNGHHHCHTFPVVRGVLREVLGESDGPRWMRRTVEPRGARFRFGAKLKRALLRHWGHQSLPLDAASGWVGAGELVGLIEPGELRDGAIFARWLAISTADTVELMVHPGFEDETILGRDTMTRGPQFDRRARETELLRASGFREAVGGFVLTAALHLGL